MNKAVYHNEFLHISHSKTFFEFFDAIINLFLGVKISKLIPKK